MIGLDECLRFLIVSRSEPHIRDGFDGLNLSSFSKRLMHDDFQTQNDIEKYLQDGFADICRKSPSMVAINYNDSKGHMPVWGGVLAGLSDGIRYKIWITWITSIPGHGMIKEAEWKP